jgi:hypothetical protein
MSDLPNTEQMLDDLSKREGLDTFWQMLAMGLQVLPHVFSDDEVAIIAKQAAKRTGVGQ